MYSVSYTGGQPVPTDVMMNFNKHNNQTNVPLNVRFSNNRQQQYNQNAATTNNPNSYNQRKNTMPVNRTSANGPKSNNKYNQYVILPRKQTMPLTSNPMYNNNHRHQQQQQQQQYTPNNNNNNNNNIFNPISSYNNHSPPSSRGGGTRMIRPTLQNSQSVKTKPNMIKTNNMPSMNPTMRRPRSQTCTIDQIQQQQQQQQTYQPPNIYCGQMNNKKTVKKSQINNYNEPTSPIPKNCGLIEPGDGNQIHPINESNECPLQYIGCNEFDGGYLSKHYDEHQQEHLDLIINAFNVKIKKLENRFSQKLGGLQEENDDLRRKIIHLNKANDEILQVLMNVIDKTQIDVEIPQSPTDDDEEESSEDEDDNIVNIKHNDNMNRLMMHRARSRTEGFNGDHYEEQNGNQNGNGNKSMGWNSFLNKQRRFSNNFQ